MYIVGSFALNYWANANFHEPGKDDIDIITSEQELGYIGLSFDGRDQIKVGDVEYINIELLNNKDIANYADCHTFVNGEVSGYIINPVGLYLMKRSHLHRPIKWTKHMMHFQTLKRMAKTFNPQDVLFLTQRVRLTKEKYPDRVPSLKKTNEAFFDDQVKKYYVHDDIHEIMAYGDRPLYLKLKTDLTLALCKKDLWELLSDEEKTMCVAEECRVIALERFIIPGLMKGERHMPAFMAFDKALEKVCTTLTSGYFRDYAIDNWAAVRAIQGDFLSIFHSKKEGLTKL